MEIRLGKSKSVRIGYLPKLLSPIYKRTQPTILKITLFLKSVQCWSGVRRQNGKISRNKNPEWHMLSCVTLLGLNSGPCKKLQVSTRCPEFSVSLDIFLIWKLLFFILRENILKNQSSVPFSEIEKTEPVWLKQFPSPQNGGW